MKPPSDTSLQRRFYEHRADLEQIVKMMEQDVHMFRIAQDFTWSDDSVSIRKIKISEDRWNQYREIFRLAGVPKGTSRDSAGDIEIIAWTAGLAIAGTTLSYVHCGKKTSTDLEKALFYPASSERNQVSFGKKMSLSDTNESRETGTSTSFQTEIERPMTPH